MVNVDAYSVALSGHSHRCFETADRAEVGRGVPQVRWLIFGASRTEPMLLQCLAVQLNQPHDIAHTIGGEFFAQHRRMKGVAGEHERARRFGRHPSIVMAQQCLGL